MDPKFDSSVSIADVLDLVQSIRAKKSPMLLLKKSLWIAGCAVEQFDGIPPVTGAIDTNLSLDDAVDQLHAHVAGFGAEAQPTQLNPVVKGLLKIIIQKLLEAW